MNQNFSSDKPVENESQDRFQRYNFSKRIANTILQRENQEGIVIGIYGAWGEGKTSVQNFIEKELESKDSVLIIKLNPWRYNDEDALIISFLKKIADVLGKELENKKQKLGTIIEKYGSIGGVFGVDISNIGKSLAEVNLEDLKNRIDEFLKESNCKLVVFIDDIDRLDKQEIYSIFRLVKLTGDFSNTTYILSFDEVMVASAIGERFGAGNEQSGQNFLEKIIQVPLKIPQAQVEALKKYCFELVDKAIAESELEFSQDDAQRFTYQFAKNILLRLKTPRLAVRYGNSLSFAFPLLKGEVNHVDLMLIEAVKIFYPRHYEFVKSNPDYFISSYSTNSTIGNGEHIKERKDELIKQLDVLASDLTKTEKASILSLLKTLFPRLNEAFHNTFQHEGHKEWYKKKNIVSTSYFNRYFSYSVIDGELSDVFFDDFIKSIEFLKIEEIIEKIEDIVSKNKAGTFIFKIRTYEEELNWEISKKLAIAIGFKGSDFPSDGSIFNFGYDSEQKQAAIFIYQLIKNHSDNEERFEFTKTLFDLSISFDFAYQVYDFFKIKENVIENTFTMEQLIELAKILRDKALLDCQSESLFNKYPEQILFLFSSWKEYDKDGFDLYLTTILNKEPKDIKNLLSAFTPTARSTSHPEPYKSNFTKEQYNYFTTLVDKELIHKLIRDNYGDEVDEKVVEFFDFKNNQTEINILRQFEHWYLELLETN